MLHNINFAYWAHNLLEEVRANSEKLNLGLHNGTRTMYSRKRIQKGYVSTLQSLNIMKQSDDMDLDNTAISKAYY